MSLILHIETATDVCSVALAKNAKILSIVESSGVYHHAENLTGYIRKVLDEATVSFKELSAVAVSIGPGSYTGLRIGLSTAKGMCYAGKIPMITVSTLDNMAEGMRMKLQEKLSKDHFLCPMIDARRMEVYLALYDGKLNPLLKPVPKVIDEKSIHDLLLDRTIFVGGNGAGKCKTFIEMYPNATYLDNVYTFSPIHDPHCI